MTQKCKTLRACDNCFVLYQCLSKNQLEISWMNLPQELILIIASELSMSGLMHLSGTCRYFAKLCSSAQLWTAKMVQEFPEYYGNKCSIPPRLYYQALHRVIPIRNVAGLPMFTPIGNHDQAHWIRLMYPFPPLHVYDEGENITFYFSTLEGMFVPERRYRYRLDIEIYNFGTGLHILQLQIRVDLKHLGLLDGISCPSVQDISADNRPFFNGNVAFASALGMEVVPIYHKDLEKILTRARDLGFLTLDEEYIKTEDVHANYDFFSVIRCDE